MRIGRNRTMQVVRLLINSLSHDCCRLRTPQMRQSERCVPNSEISPEERLLT